jgi:putative holliday junction resolvase
VRVMGIDLGERRIGLALSDPTGMLASPLRVLERPRKMKRFLEVLADLCREHEVGEIVVGLPLSMDGSVGTKAAEARDFIARLRAHTGLPVVAWDERLSTVAAERALIEAGMRRERRKQVIDKTAAALILAGYLERRRWSESSADAQAERLGHDSQVQSSRPRDLDPPFLPAAAQTGLEDE